MAEAKKTTLRNGSKPDFKAEAAKIREWVDTVIKNGQAKTFLVDHGFVTKGGRLTKRYGG